MRRRGLEKMLARYQPQVAQLFGVQANQPTSISIRNIGTNPAYSSHETGDITFDRNFLRTASRQDIRGALIHEATHALGVGSQGPERKVETFADYARYMLNPREDPNWNPSAAVLRMAEKRGDVPTQSGNRGPRPGNNNRNRNTNVNNASKYPNGYQAPVSSASAVQYGDQLAMARMQYLQQLAALKAQRSQIGQQYGMAVTDARGAAIGNMVGAEANALERGVVGSSSDLSARAGVIADRQRAIAEAQAARISGRLGLAQQAIGVRGDYYSQLSSIQNAMAQEQMANTINAFGNDSFDALQQNYQDVLAQLRNQKSGRNPRRRRGTRGNTDVVWGANGAPQNYYSAPTAYTGGRPTFSQGYYA